MDRLSQLEEKLTLDELKKKFGATIKIGSLRFKRFIPYPEPVNDGTLRCIGCGQIDEEEFHNRDACLAARA